MADITMCANAQCPNASTCYRVTATPNDHWQSMAMFEYSVIEGAVECENYIQNDEASLEQEARWRN